MVIIILLSLGSCNRIVYLILRFRQHFMGSFAMNENVKATFVVCVFGGERCVERSREKTIPTEMRYAKKIKEKKCALPGLFTNIKRFPLDLGLSQCARLYLCDGVFRCEWGYYMAYILYPSNYYRCAFAPRRVQTRARRKQTAARAGDLESGEPAVNYPFSYTPKN